MGGGGSPKGWVHILLMQFFTVRSSQIEVSEHLCSFYPILCVCCLDWILCEVDLPKAIEFSTFSETLLSPLGWLWVMI